MSERKSFSQFAFYPGSDRARISDVTYHSTIFQNRDEQSLQTMRNKLYQSAVIDAETFNVNSSPDTLSVSELEYKLGLRRIENPNLEKINESERLW